MSQSSKLVIFRFGQGSFEQGFPVTMEIFTEQNAPLTTLSASLPAMPELADCYNQWLASYRNLETTYRLTPKPNQITHGSVLKDCQVISQDLGNYLNRWLQSDSIRNIREKLIQRIDQDDDIRLLFQTDQIELQRLPWHLWELLSRYSNAEVAVLPQSHDDIPLSPPRSKIRILAVFGDDSGINVDQDRVILEKNFPDAVIIPLNKPTRKELTDTLWDREGWDIFFFAGHSTEREVGIFQINENESINIKMLAKTLPRAVKNGLRLVIFNSCNGLRLANDLSSSGVPQIIVMRESVPDYVAQTFLSNFLQAFAIEKKKLFTAVREARDQLEAMEDNYPCADWLPVIYQNCRSISQTIDDWLLPELPAVQPWFKRLPWKVALASSLAVTGAVFGLRWMGTFQPLEIAAYDWFSEVQAKRQADNRFLVIRVTEKDRQRYKDASSISDKPITNLLKKLQAYKPAVIGLDIIRDIPIGNSKQGVLAHEELTQHLQKSKDIIGICVSPDDGAKEFYASPPGMDKDYLGFVNMLPDRDGKYRRQLVSIPNAKPPCPATTSLSLQVAKTYLKAAGTNVSADERTWKLGNVKLNRLDGHSGGYQGRDSGGFNTLFSYRLPLELAAHTASLNEILDEQDEQVLKNLIEGKIVMIGYDLDQEAFLTPFHDEWTARRVPGIVLHAQKASYLIDVALGERPAMWFWKPWGDALWMLAWSGVAGCIVLYFQTPRNRLIFTSGGIIILSVSCWLIFMQGGWVPWVPTIVVMVITDCLILLCLSSQSRTGLRTV